MYPFRLTQAASASWDQLKLQTTAGLQDALKTRKHFEIDVTLHSPYLVVPENGCYTKDAHLLVVDLGKLTLNGSTKDPHSLDEVCSINIVKHFGKLQKNMNSLVKLCVTAIHTCTPSKIHVRL